MMVKMTTFAGAAAGLLAMTACTPPHLHHHGDASLKTISSLDCPDSQGDLTRKSQSPDGKTCVYTDGSGSDVTLQLVALNGQDAKTALAPIETALRAELPPNGKDAPGTATGGDSGRVDIDLPGIHIHASDKNDAKIDIGGGGNKGADASGPSASPGISIDAHDKDAQISINESGSGVRIAYILASDAAGPNGYRVIGYEARGPASGPLAVVSIRSKADDADDLREDARSLLHHNVGG